MTGIRSFPRLLLLQNCQEQNYSQICNKRLKTKMFLVTVVWKTFGNATKGCERLRPQTRGSQFLVILSDPELVWVRLSKCEKLSWHTVTLCVCVSLLHMYTVQTIACHYAQLLKIPKLSLSLYCHTWSITSSVCHSQLMWRQPSGVPLESYHYTRSSS